jgi:hypothetical protein
LNEAILDPKYFPKDLLPQKQSILNLLREHIHLTKSAIVVPYFAIVAKILTAA